MPIRSLELDQANLLPGTKHSTHPAPHQSLVSQTPVLPAFSLLFLTSFTPLSTSSHAPSAWVMRSTRTATSFRALSTADRAILSRGAASKFVRNLQGVRTALCVLSSTVACMSFESCCVVAPPSGPAALSRLIGRHYRGAASRLARNLRGFWLSAGE